MIWNGYDMKRIWYGRELNILVIGALINPFLGLHISFFGISYILPDLGSLHMYRVVCDMVLNISKNAYIMFLWTHHMTIWYKKNEAMEEITFGSGNSCFEPYCLEVTSNQGTSLMKHAKLLQLFIY